MIEGKYLFELYPNESEEKLLKVINLLTDIQKNILFKVFGNELNKKAALTNLNKKEKEILYVTITKSLLFFLEKDKEIKTQEIYLTDNLINDTYNKLEYKPQSKKQETIWLKKLKLSYYYEVDEETKIKYFNYYCEVNPTFKKKYEKANEITKRSLLKQAIEDATIERKKFIKNNIRLVISTAAKFDNPILREELFQEGTIGLIKAVEKFDVKADNKFSTYAIWWIKRNINRYITDDIELIRLPLYSNKKLKQIKKEANDLYKTLKRKPTIKELSIKTGIPEKKIETLLIYTNYCTNIASLDYTENDDDNSLNDYIIDINAEFEDTIDNKQITEQLKKIIDNLESTEKTIIYMRMGLYDGHPYTLDEIANSLGQNREKIRTIELKALKIIRKKYERNNTKTNNTETSNSNKEKTLTKESTELTPKEKINLALDEIVKLDYISMQIILLKYKLQFDNKTICKTLNITEDYLLDKEKDILTQLRKKLREEKHKKILKIKKRNK